MALKPLDQSSIRYLVVHCSATRPSQDLGVTDIDRMHRLRGFLKVGYHFVIKRDGTVQTGRGLSEVGAHAEGHNSESLGICLIGGVEEDGKTPSDNFTSAQKHSLIRVLTKMKAQLPNAEVLGHRDLPNVAKACPCFDVRSWWATVNQA